MKTKQLPDCCKYPWCDYIDYTDNKVVEYDLDNCKKCLGDNDEEYLAAVKKLQTDDKE